MLSDALIARLKRLANQRTIYDEPEFDMLDAAAGNFDDAFSIGFEAGESLLSRDILNELGVDWEDLSGP